MEPYLRFLTDWLGPNWKGPVFFGVLGIFCLLLGLWLVWDQRRLAAAARRMTQVEGVLRQLEVHESARQGKLRTSIEVEAAFAVDGRNYVCRRYELYGGGARFHAERPAPLLHAGDTVVVSYDRRNPAVCALSVGRPRYGYGLMAVAAAAAFVALAALIVRANG